MTKVKICGITNLEDALLSAKFGADALGFNFYEKSPRFITPKKAREIIEQLPEEVLKVGVFVNEDLDKIVEIAEIAKLDALQLHGEETPEFVRELKAKTNLEIIKAFRVSPDFAPEDVLKYETDAILLDAYSPKEHGGTGETFDWGIAKKVQESFPKMYLAGGLSNDNIDCALRQTNCFAVDTCSCLEKEKGSKDKIKLVNFITKVRHFDWWQKISNHKDFKITNIYEYLNLIHLRPAMYIGEKSLTTLGIFINGLKEGLLLYQNDFDWKNFHSVEFHNYIKDKLGKREFASLNGFCIDLYKSDEETAFDIFFALLEEFKLEKEDLTNE
jgi:phosphoribosylanthranilate isomerase